MNKQESLNKILGLLDAAAAELQQVFKGETDSHHKRLLGGMYQGINAERKYVADYEESCRLPVGKP